MTIANRLYLLNVSCLEDDTVFKMWYDRMDPDRKRKIDAMKPPKGKRLSLGAGILLIKALEEAGITDFEVIRPDRGKPHLKDHSDIFFNLSHSEDMAVLGISAREIGVDIEENKSFKDSLADYVYSENEKALAKELSASVTLPDDGKEITPLDIVYTRFWTMKESIMKHSGRGIALEPKKIELFSDDGRMRARTQGYDCSKLNLITYTENSYQITVCTEYDSFAGISYLSV